MRQPLELPTGCVDWLAADGESAWRDSWGYTCDSYRYGRFCELDGSGRILLPQPLREYAYLEKEAVLMGQGKKLELWSKETWEGRRDEYLDMAGDPDELPEELQSLSL